MFRMRMLLVGSLLCLPGGALAQPTDDVRYYHTDAIGSVRMITDAAGTVVARHDYLPFGEEWQPPTVNNTRRFAGKERDLETGFDYFGGRYLRSGSGRFTTVDPQLGIDTALTDPQRWNRYSYVGNRPTQLVDPDGRGWASVLFKVGKALAKGASVGSEFAGAASDFQTVTDSEATLLDRGLAFTSLATEVASPLSVRDVIGVGSFAVEQGARAVSYSRSTFRRGLAALTGGAVEGAHAHHMFPIKFASRFERAFGTAGYSINDPRYGAWWEAQNHLRNAKGYMNDGRLSSAKTQTQRRAKFSISGARSHATTA